MPTIRSDNPLVSIIIISYNRSEALRRCVLAARAQTYSNTEIIIVDNNSEDDGCQRIEAEFPDVKIIRLHRNVGWPMAKNIASANARGEFIYFLDDDLYLLPEAVEKAIEILQNHPELILVSGQFLDLKTDKCYKMSIWGKQDVMPSEQYTTTIYGGHAAWRADGLKKVGYYPEHALYGGLDSYIGQRALDLGYLIFWSPDILGYHEGRKEGRDNDRNFQQTFLNRIHLAWALHPLPYAISGTFLPVFQFGRVAIKRRLFVSFLKSLPKIPLTVIQGIRSGRRPVKWSTMSLRAAMNRHSPKTLEELKRLCPPGHPVWETCERELAGKQS